MIALPIWLKNGADLQVMSNFLEKMRSFYIWLDHDRDIFGDTQVPDFIIKAVGTNLHKLPTFAIDTHKHEHAEGLGIFLDAVHHSMRAFGNRIGHLFEKGLEKSGVENKPKCPFANLRQKVEAIKDGFARVKDGDFEVEIEMDAKECRLAYCGKEMSKRLLERDPDEQDILRTSTGGTASRLFTSLLNLCGVISRKAAEKGMSQYDAEEKLFDINYIQKKFELPEVRSAFRTLNNVLVFHTQRDELFVVSMKDVMRSMGVEAISKHGFVTETPQDIASLYYGCYRELGFQGFPYELAEQLGAAQTMEDARRILNEDMGRSVVTKMKIYARHDATKEAVALLEKEMMLGFSVAVADKAGKAGAAIFN